MVNVYLDDIRPCPRGFLIARTMEECARLLTTEKVDVLSLDHDLGFGKPTGYDLVKYMVKNNLYPKTIIIHSANPFGRFRMFTLLNRYKPKHVAIIIRPEPLFRRKTL